MFTVLFPNVRGLLISHYFSPLKYGFFYQKEEESGFSLSEKIKLFIVSKTTEYIFYYEALCLAMPKQVLSGLSESKKPIVYHKKLSFTSRKVTGVF